MSEPKFEDALKKLEEIVGDLESGELRLDDAIKKYEEGMKLSNFCYKKLNEIQKKIEVLVKDSSGKLTQKGFETEEIKEDSPSGTEEQKQGPLSKKKRPKGEELLF